MIPSWVVREEGGVLRNLNKKYLGMLSVDRLSIVVFDRFGVPLGRISMPHSRRVVSYCSGGGYIYMLGHGSRPDMWRMKTPEMLDV